MSVSKLKSTQIKEGQPSAARAILARAMQKYATFEIPGDPPIVIKHKTYTLPRYVDMGLLPSAFSAVLTAKNKIASEQLDKLKDRNEKGAEMAAEIAEGFALSFREVYDAGRSLLIELAIEPQFHEGESDEDAGILNIDTVEDQFVDFFKHITSDPDGAGQNTSIQIGENEFDRNSLGRFPDAQ